MKTRGGFGRPSFVWTQQLKQLNRRPPFCAGSSKEEQTHGGTDD